MHAVKSEKSGTRLLSVLAAAVAVAVVCVAPVVTASLRAEEEFAAAAQFSAFKQQYGKAYATLEEEAHRLRVFKESMAEVKVLNAANPYATFGVTQFSDLTREEFEKYYANGAKHEEADLVEAPEMLAELNITVPTTIDWRERGAVTPVKQQGSCGSCWAFAAIGNVEGVWKNSGQPLTALSEQQMVSCDRSSYGCDGGNALAALRWVIRQQGGVIVTAASWPYVSANKYIPPCNTGGRQVGARIRDAGRLSPNEEQIAAQLSTRGPLAAALDATSLQYYRGGVITNCVARNAGHAVLIVGYSKAANPPHWIIKNSWGGSWGESGYLRIFMGNNQCLINSYVETAIV